MVRKSFLAPLLALAGALAFSTTGHSLTRNGGPWNGEIPWSSSVDCQLSYYNSCNGWIWVWAGWRTRDRLGVVFDACCPQAEVVSTWTYVVTGQPYGWGYTTIALQAVDGNDCPSGAPIAEHVRNGWEWTLDSWDGVAVPGRFAVVETIYWLAGGGAPTATRVTDHPAQGGSVPAACGSCYPTTRVNRSYLWGDANAPLCPGQPFFDGTCDAQLLLTVELNCPTSIEPSTWGAIKALYR